MDNKGAVSEKETSSLIFTKNMEKNIDLGLTESFIWLRFRVKNDSDITN